MKKLLLLFLTAVFAVTAMAQTSMETALDLQEGVNSHDYEGSPVYWKYTPPTGQGDRLLLISADGSTSITVTDEAPDGTQTTMYGAQMAYPQKAYIAYEGHTLYISVQSYSGTSVGFTASFDADASFGGSSQEAPMTIVTDGSRMVMGDVYSNNQSSSYATYTADSDGVLVLTASGYVSYSVEGGASGSFQYTDGSYKASLTVRNGQTYNITLSGYGAFILTAEMTHPTEGSFEMPFEMKEGDNTVPAGFTDTSVPNPGYWYTYTNTKTGYGVISSDNTLGGGSIKVYRSTYDIQNEQVYAQVEGSYNLRFEMPSVGTTYYICITKVEASAADETFIFTAEDYQPGDQESNPIVIEQLPATGISTEAVGGTRYYAVDIPEGESKFLNVTATSTIANDATTVAVYPNGNQYSATTGNSSVRVLVNGGQRYMIRWVSQESEPITFDVTLEDIAQGEVITNPLQAVSGTNTIEGSGTRYYTYTATLSGILTVAGTPAMTVTFPRGTGQYDGNYQSSQVGTAFSIDVTEGTTYLIRIDGAADGDTFELSEREYQQGESSDNPIIVEGNSYTICDNSSNLWLKYTVKTDGILEIDASTITYNYGSDMIYYGMATTGTPIMTSMIRYTSGSSVFYTEIPVTAGEEYFVNVKFSTSLEGTTIYFNEREPEAGETLSNPLILNNGEGVRVSYNASRTNPVWCKASIAEAGTITLTATECNYISGNWYSSIEDAQNDNNAGYISFMPEYDESNVIQSYKADIDIPAAGDYYFKITQATDNGLAYVILTLTGNTTSGIGSVEAENGQLITVSGNNVNVTADNATVNIYTVSGAAIVSEKVSGNASFSLDKGIYIVKINNTVKKVIVK